MHFPHNQGPLVPGFFTVLSGVFSVIVALVIIVVVVGVIFLLVRFLLVGTKAAQLYIDRNTVGETVAPAPPVTPATVADVTPTTPIATKPAARTRAPRTPPTE